MSFIKQEVEGIMAALKRGKARCAAEKRNPSPVEIQTINESLDRLEMLEKESKTMNRKIAKEAINNIASRVEREGGLTTEKEREIIAGCEQYLEPGDMPEIFSKSVSLPLLFDPNEGSGQARPVTPGKKFSGGDSGGFRDIGEYFATLVRDKADVRLKRLEIMAMETGTFSEGGALVPEAFSNQLIGLIVEKSLLLPG